MAEPLTSYIEPEISLEESPELDSDRIDDLIRWLRERQVEEIECHTPDMSGIARGKLMPASKWFKNHTFRLPTSLHFSTITGHYIDMDKHHDPYETDADIDVVPDLKTATALPWTDVPSIQIIHDVVDGNNRPIPYAPRNVLRRVLNAYKRKGWKPLIAPELEFYLTKPNTDADLPLEPPVGRSGRIQISNQAYSMQGADEYEGVIAHLYEFADAQNIDIDTIIQEYGTG